MVKNPGKAGSSCVNESSDRRFGTIGTNLLMARGSNVLCDLKASIGK